MTLDPTVVRTLELRIETYLGIAYRLFYTGLVVGTTEGAMLLNLLQTIGAVEEAPANEVETTTELTTELLRTLNVSNLLEQLIGIARELS